MDALRILVAVDNGLVLEAIIAYLQKKLPHVAVEVTDCTDGVVEWLEGIEKFDAVFLDLQMPGMKGPVTLAELTDKFPRSKFAVLSGTATRDEALRCINAGARGFVTKSANLDDLVETIEAVCNGHVHLPSALFSDQVDDARSSSDNEVTLRERVRT